MKKKKKKKKRSAFPKPKKPLSLKQTVEKIMKVNGYGKFIHSLICKSRRPDQEAANVVFAYYRPEPSELKALKLPPELLDHKDVDSDSCTTTFMFIDFVKYY